MINELMRDKEDQAINPTNVKDKHWIDQDQDEQDLDHNDENFTINNRSDDQSIATQNTNTSQHSQDNNDGNNNDQKDQPYQQQTVMEKWNQ